MSCSQSKTNLVQLNPLQSVQTKLFQPNPFQSVQKQIILNKFIAIRPKPIFLNQVHCSQLKPILTLNRGSLVNSTFLTIFFIPSSYTLFCFLYFSRIHIWSRTIQFLLRDATLSHMVKECRKLFSSFLCSNKN
jgi:hypothetical protein